MIKTAPDDWGNFNAIAASVKKLKLYGNCAFLLVQEGQNLEDLYANGKPFKRVSYRCVALFVSNGKPCDALNRHKVREQLCEEGDISEFCLLELPYGITTEKFGCWIDHELRAKRWMPSITDQKTAIHKGTHVVVQDTGARYDSGFLTIKLGGAMSLTLDQLDLPKRQWRQICNHSLFSDGEGYKSRIRKAIDSQKTGASSLKASNDMPDSKSLPRVLLLGESGCGKSLIAQYLSGGTHAIPSFKRVSLPEYLDAEQHFEHDTFGYCKGHFTGADESSLGYLLSNLGGVVFFDEIGEANPTIQAKLLAFMDDYLVRPRGWTGAGFYCPVLIVAATNRPVEDWALQEGSERGHFRRDLLERFTSVIKIPSLQERIDELPYILDTMLQMEAFNPNGRIEHIGVDAYEALHAWIANGAFKDCNFRSLERVIRLACAEAVRQGLGTVSLEHLQSSIRNTLLETVIKRMNP